MKSPYVRKCKTPGQSPWKTNAEGFRMIRVFTIDHNAKRFRRHIEELQRKDRRTHFGRRFAFKLRVQRMGQP